ncbi:MAG: hypothetical protein ACJ8M1_06790 [Chthoniobacterales bacterium]
MKLHLSKSRWFPFVAVFAIVLAFASTSDARHGRYSGWGEGRLVIKRAPDLGNLAYVQVKIDGALANGLLYAQGYDAPLASGRHLIEVRLAPGLYTYSPSALILDVHPGQTYSFQAAKRGGALVLARDGYLFR